MSLRVQCRVKHSFRKVDSDLLVQSLSITCDHIRFDLRPSKIYNMSKICKDHVNFELTPATRHDIAEMVDVHTRAFVQDQFSNFMLQGRPNGTHEEMMRRSIEHWLKDSNARLITAKDTSGQILGWSCLIVKEGTGGASGISSEPSGPVMNGEESEQIPQTRLGSISDGSDQEQCPTLSSSEARERLSTIWRQDSIRAETKHMVESTYVVLQALVTDPAWQHCGIGTRLTKWAIQLAEAQQLPCWVHASMAAHSLYRRLGFVEVERTEFDLDRWASTEHKAAAESWGQYTFHCMKRVGASDYTKTVL